MRVAAKLALALFLGLIAILSVEGAIRLRETSARQQAEVTQDLEILARALSAGAGRIWGHAGEAEALSFLSSADETRDRIEIDTRPLSPGTSAPPAGSVDVRPAEGGADLVLLATTPIYVNGTAAGTLELRRSLPRLGERAASNRRSRALAALSMAALFSVVALWLGYYLIGKPVETLQAQAQSVAQGKFEGRNEIRRRDEIGALAQDLNRMTDRLAEAHADSREDRRARTRALGQLRHADRLNTVGRLASSIAHELGTPLNVVGGRAAMIQEGDELPQEVIEHATIIKEQSERMAVMIREMLDFVRREPLRSEPHPVRKVIDEATLLMEPLAEERGALIRVKAVPGLVANIDPQKVLQAATNVLMNALDAMPGGGTVTVTAGRRHVEEPPTAFAEPGRYVFLEIADEGVGMTEDRLKTIFEPFYTTKDPGRGTGLGLSVTQDILRELGGWIDVASEPGNGTSFTMFLQESEGE